MFKCLFVWTRGGGLVAGIGACLFACCEREGAGWSGRSFGCMQAWERGNLASCGKLTSGLATTAGAVTGFIIAPMQGLFGPKVGANLARGVVGLLAGPVETATPLNFIRDCRAFSCASLSSARLLPEIGAGAIVFPFVAGISLHCFCSLELASEFKVWVSPV